MPTDPQQSPLLRPHYAAFDGLRGLGLIAVFLAHYGPLAWPSLQPVFFWGYPALDMFFVLSSFLITSILIRAANRQTPHALRSFYTRRALRLLPPYLAIWLVLLAVALLLHPSWTRYQLSFLIYLGNLFMAGGAAGHHADPSFFYYVTVTGRRFYITIGHLWTLCQEEQFYLLFPAVLFAFRRRQPLLMQLCIAALAATFMYRLWLQMHAPADLLAADLIYYNPLTHSDSILTGAALSLWLHSPAAARVSTARLNGISYALMAIPSLLLLAALFTSNTQPLTHHNPLLMVAGTSLFSMMFTGLILNTLMPGSAITAFTLWPVFRHLGRLSYSFYLVHFLPYQFFVDHAVQLRARHIGFAGPLAAFGLSYALALLSMRFIEGPFLNLKSKVAPMPAEQTP